MQPAVEKEEISHFSFMQQYEAKFPFAVMCSVLNVFRNGYYTYGARRMPSCLRRFVRCGITMGAPAFIENSKSMRSLAERSAFPPDAKRWPTCKNETTLYGMYYSMSCKGDCWNNALIEIGSLKQELVFHQVYSGSRSCSPEHF